MHPPIPTGHYRARLTVSTPVPGITGQGNGLSTRRVAFRNRPRAALEARVRTRGLAFGGRRGWIQ